YPDGYTKTLYNSYPSATDQFHAPNGQSVTYGHRGLGGSDYHCYRLCLPAPPTRFPPPTAKVPPTATVAWAAAIITSTALAPTRCITVPTWCSTSPPFCRRIGPPTCSPRGRTTSDAHR